MPATKEKKGLQKTQPELYRLLIKTVLPDAMDMVSKRVGRKITLDDYYFYLEEGVVPKIDQWRNDDENPRVEATINTCITKAQDFIEANDHYALVICHVETFPHGKGFMPRLYWTRLQNIHAKQKNLTLRWDDKGDLFATGKDGREFQTQVEFRHLDHKGNGDAYRMKFYADAYATAVEEGRKYLAERTAQDIKEEKEDDERHARYEKRKALEKAKLDRRKARRNQKKFKHRQWKRAKQ